MKNLGFMGYPNYSVTEDGKVFSFLSKRFLKSSEAISKNNVITLRVNLFNEDGPKTIETYKLVANAFIPNPDNLPVINHKDGNKLNNDVSNLEWCTHSHNTQHAYDNGLLISKKGSKAKNATLTDEQVKEIRERYIPYVVSIRDLVKMYNSSYSIIQGVVSRTRYI